MEKIVKTIKKASDDWDVNHNDDAFVDALIELEKTTYKMKIDRLKEIFEQDKRNTLWCVFSAAKTSLAHFSPNKPVPWRLASQVRRETDQKSADLELCDWQIMLKCAGTAKSYFEEALCAAIYDCKVDYKIKIPYEVHCNYGTECVGDDCWYASNCDRGEPKTFYFNVIDRNIYCDMCYKDYSFVSDDMEELTEEFMAFLAS